VIYKGEIITCPECGLELYKLKKDSKACCLEVEKIDGGPTEAACEEHQFNCPECNTFFKDEHGRIHVKRGGWVS
jgi:uncharacterized C2H2 Zn-finger protein